MSLILSVVAATSLRALEVLLAALFPGMPRYAIVRRIARFVAGAPRAPTDSPGPRCKLLPQACSALL